MFTKSQLFGFHCQLKSHSIVAVHGIGANPDYTWTTSGVNWLEDRRMLPQELPSARILRFGYDSQWFGDSAIRQRLSAVAESLLYTLQSERKVVASVLKIQL